MEVKNHESTQWRTRPDFTLTDYTGREISLSQYRGSKNILLVFTGALSDPIAAGTWRSCARRRTTWPGRTLRFLSSVRKRKRPFGNTGKKKPCPFVGLPDPEHSVMKLYGQEVKLLKLGRMPAQMLIDTKGVIRYVHYGSSMADIPDIREVIDALRDDVLLHRASHHRQRLIRTRRVLFHGSGGFLVSASADESNTYICLDGPFHYYLFVTHTDHPDETPQTEPATRLRQSTHNSRIVQECS